MVVGIIFCAATALTLQLQLSLILMVIVDVCLTSAFQMLQVLMHNSQLKMVVGIIFLEHFLLFLHNQKSLENSLPLMGNVCSLAFALF
jgi:hypothetical protein